MKLPWRRDRPPATRPAFAGAAVDAAAAQTCPSLGRVLEKILKRDKPEILDLGPFCGATAVYLADRGARVSVDGFDPPPPTPPPERGHDPPQKVPLVLDQPDERFHLVLAWEWFDFTPPDRLAELGAEVRRVLAEDGWVLLLARNKPSGSEAREGRPASFRVLADDRIQRQAHSGSPRARWVHPNRDIERALGGLSLQGIHLQRNQTREFLALKRPRRAP